MKLRYAATGLLLITALTAGLAPGRAWASDNSADQGRPIWLYASARFGPIGAVKTNSLTSGAVAIDGRVAQGEELIWGGELIKVLADHTVRVAFDSIGQVTLARGAMVRFAYARGSADDTGYNVLVASIIDGSVDVKLNASAGAYVEVRVKYGIGDGDVVAASQEAHYRGSSRIDGVNQKQGGRDVR